MLLRAANSWYRRPRMHSASLHDSTPRASCAPHVVLGATKAWRFGRRDRRNEVLGAEMTRTTAKAPAYTDLPLAKPCVARVGPGLCELRIRLEVVTPILGGSHLTRAIDDVDVIRAASVRGHLRFWWRALYASQCSSDEELYQRESTLWGRAATDARRWRSASKSTASKARTAPRSGSIHRKASRRRRARMRCGPHEHRRGRHADGTLLPAGHAGSKVEGLMVDRMDQNQEIITRYLNDPQFQDLAFRLLVKRIYDEIREDREAAG